MYSCVVGIISILALVRLRLCLYVAYIAQQKLSKKVEKGIAKKTLSFRGNVLLSRWAKARVGFEGFSIF